MGRCDSLARAPAGSAGAASGSRRAVTRWIVARISDVRTARAILDAARPARPAGSRRGATTGRRTARAAPAPAARRGAAIAAVGGHRLRASSSSCRASSARLSARWLSIGHNASGWARPLFRAGSASNRICQFSDPSCRRAGRPDRFRQPPWGRSAGPVARSRRSARGASGRPRQAGPSPCSISVIRAESAAMSSAVALRSCSSSEHVTHPSAASVCLGVQWPSR